MSFTSDMFDAIEKDLREKPMDNSKSMAMRLVRYHNELQAAFAVNKVSNLRALYLSVGEKVETPDFPKWKGVSIELAKLPDYSDKELYVVFKELPNGTQHVFDIVAEDLRKTIEEVSSPEESLDATINTLSKWKTFFQYDGEVLMSSIRQQGLMAELCFLEKAIESIGIHSVMKWAGSDDETHDFYFDHNAVEIKSTSVKEPYKSHISSEYQLDQKEVLGDLFLVFFAFRSSNSAGTTLPQMVNRIRDSLTESQSMLSQYNDKLHKYGYYDEVSELYKTGYYIRDTFYFRISEGFPSIVPAMLQKGISKVEYTLEIDHCSNYCVEEEELLSELKGDQR